MDHRVMWIGEYCFLVHEVLGHPARSGSLRTQSLHPSTETSAEVQLYLPLISDVKRRVTSRRNLIYHMEGVCAKVDRLLAT